MTDTNTDDSPILVTGASGMIGRALSLRHPSIALPRRDPGNGDPWWEPANEQVHDLPQTLQTVVHLAGENVAGGRWTKKRKERIWNSRVQGTRVLVNALISHPHPPDTLIMASGISFYGSHADTPLTEASPPGDGFLATLSQAWEEAAQPAISHGIRVVFLRLGVVLSPQGGALAKMLPSARAGLGGALGTGQQWMAWVHIDDAISAILWAAQNRTAVGAYNLVAPEAVRQGSFAKKLGHVLGRPSVMKIPAAFLRLGFGQMGEETVLASHRAIPQRLLDGGFSFAWPELTPALNDLL